MMFGISFKRPRGGRENEGIDDNKIGHALRIGGNGEGYVRVYDTILSTFVYVWYFPC